MSSSSSGDFKCLASRARLAESSRRGWVLSKQRGEIALRNPVVDPGSPPTIDHLSKAADTPFAEALERLAERGLQRRLRPTSGRQGPRMRVDGHDVLMMAGSNYLDLAGDERVLLKFEITADIAIPEAITGRPAKYPWARNPYNGIFISGWGLFFFLLASRHTNRKRLG